MLEKITNLSNENSGFEDAKEQEERETLAYIKYEFSNLNQVVKNWKTHPDLIEFRRQILTIINIKSRQFNKKTTLLTKSKTFIKDILPTINAIYVIPELVEELNKIKKEFKENQESKKLSVFNILFFKLNQQPPNV